MSKSNEVATSQETAGWSWSKFSSAVRPFEEDDDEGLAKHMWFGPVDLVVCKVGLYGPCQLGFVLLALVALVFLIIEIDNPRSDEVRYIQVIGFVISSLLLSWFAKALYILKQFREEAGRFRKMNDEMDESLKTMEAQNKELKAENDRHKTNNKDLNGSLEGLKVVMQCLEKETEASRTINENHQKVNRNLSEKVAKLGHIEQRLEKVSSECKGGVHEVRIVLDRLERNIRLHTVNSVFQFFDRCDRNKDGRIADGEVKLFVDNIAVLFQHLPSFDKEQMQSVIMDQGGLHLDQVYGLVDALMLEEDNRNPDGLGEKLLKKFPKVNSARSNHTVKSQTSDTVDKLLKDL